MDRITVNMFSILRRVQYDPRLNYSRYKCINETINVQYATIGAVNMSGMLYVNTVDSAGNWVKISEDLQDGITVWLRNFSVNRFLHLIGSNFHICNQLNGTKGGLIMTS